MAVLKPRVVRHVSFAPLLRPVKLRHEARARFKVHAYKLTVAPGVVVFRIAPRHKLAHVDFMREQRGERQGAVRVRPCVDGIVISRAATPGRIGIRADIADKLAHAPFPMLPGFGDFRMLGKHKVDKGKLADDLLRAATLLPPPPRTPRLLARVPGRVGARMQQQQRARGAQHLLG